MNNPTFLPFLISDLKIYYRKLPQVLSPLLFFIIIGCLFPIALGTEKQILSVLASGIIWICVFLSCLLSFQTFFQTELEEGYLEQLVLSPKPLSLIVLGKVTAHWLMIVVPLLLLCPFLGFLYNIQLSGLWVLMITLCLGTPVLSLMAAFMSALLLTLKNSGLMLMICIIPLMIPVLIFGTMAVEKAVDHLPWFAEGALLLALFVFSVLTFPSLIAYTLRVSLSE